MRKDTCGVLPPWFRRFGTREPGTPPANRIRSHLRGSVQSVRSTFPTCANGAGRMQPSTPLHPTRTSTYGAYYWSIQGRRRDLAGRRQRVLAGSLVLANEVASPNLALSSSSVPSQTNVHPSYCEAPGPLLWHGDRSDVAVVKARRRGLRGDANILWVLRRRNGSGSLVALRQLQRQS